MRWTFAVLLAAQCLAGDLRVAPEHILQGQTLRVYGDAEHTAARFHEHTVHLFPQPDGAFLGLLPVDVLLPPGAYPLEWLAKDGAVSQEAKIMVGNAHYGTQNVVLSKSLTQLKSTPDEREEVGDFLKQVSDTRYWKEPLEPPIPGCMTSLFGVQRLHNGKPTGDFHAGLDQRGALRTPIHAVTGGVVKLAQQYALHGGTVAIDHGQGLESMYLHMSKIEAQPGEVIAPGAVIGYVGSTGRSTGPHLHWSLYVHGQPVNPLQWVQLQPCPGTVSKPRSRTRHSVKKT